MTDWDPSEGLLWFHKQINGVIQVKNMSNPVRRPHIFSGQMYPTFVKSPNILPIYEFCYPNPGIPNSPIQAMIVLVHTAVSLQMIQ